MAARKRISIKLLCDSLTGTYRVLGQLDGTISQADPIDAASLTSISFYIGRDRDALQTIQKSKARVIICSDTLEFPEEAFKDKTLIFVPNPRLTFARILNRYFQEEIKYGIHSTAVIDKNARIHPGVFIGPYCYIGDCQIGEGTIIYGHVHIYSGTKIGKRVVINAGTIIGTEGMSFATDEDGARELLPHICGVTIEDDVWIGANASITRGVLRDTIIGQGTKIGAYCNIGHQAIIGKHCLIIVDTVTGGSCRIGDHTQTSLGVCIRDRVSIGSNTVIGMGAVVTENIGDDVVAYGIPAKVVRKKESR
jgi:UDP-3-O-[3-hydroxymyristoyl] glucosamine N-acyltransferase